MAMFNRNEGGDPGERIAELFGPAQVDHMIRQAVQYCWIGLARDRRSIDEVETQIRRMVERALRDFCEDRRAFGGAGDA